MPTGRSYGFCETGLLELFEAARTKSHSYCFELSPGPAGSVRARAHETVVASPMSDRPPPCSGNEAAALRARVAEAQRSPGAASKQTTGCAENGLPVHSFHSLLADLATLALNAITPDYPTTALTKPSPIQRKAFDLLGVPCTRSKPPATAAYPAVSMSCALQKQNSGLTKLNH